jgi:ribA/ribD-fused uncharacterized protein
MASELERFYRAKAKAGMDGDYGYDNDGNLVQRDGKGSVIKTITLPTYRRPTDEEYDVMEQTHREAIAVAERLVDEARSALYTMSQNPERNDSTMLRLNRAVMEEESKLVRIRFPLMYVAYEEDVPIKQVDFTQLTNNRKLPYDLAILQTRPFPLQEQYVRVGENPEKPLVSVAEVKSRIKAAEKEPVIVFEGPDSDDYGYLSLDWAVTIEFDSTMYYSAKQAIYAELAKFFNDEVHLPQLLAAKTADEVNYSLEDVPGENNEDKWNEQLRRLLYDVNMAKFKQYPALAVKLLETKNAILGAYLPGDMVIGTGISIDNLDAKDPSKWGENVLGKALMNIRDVLKKEAVSDVSSGADAMPLAMPDAMPLAMPDAADATATTSRKKSRDKPSVGKPSVGKPSVGKPSVGTFAPSTGTASDITIPSIAVAEEQPLMEEAPIAQQPIAQQPMAQQPIAQGGVTKRTLRMSGQRKNVSA